MQTQVSQKPSGGFKARRASSRSLSQFWLWCRLFGAWPEVLYKATRCGDRGVYSATPECVSHIDTHPLYVTLILSPPKLHGNNCSDWSLMFAMTREEEGGRHLLYILCSTASPSCYHLWPDTNQDWHCVPAEAPTVESLSFENACDRGISIIFLELDLLSPIRHLNSQMWFHFIRMMLKWIFFITHGVLERNLNAMIPFELYHCIYTYLVIYLAVHM